MRLIDADALYERITELEELARYRVIDTPNSFPNGSLNPAAIRYMAQLSERTNLKHMVFDAPTIEPARKNGHWVEIGDEPYDEWECDVCGFVIDGSGCINPDEYKDVYRFCPNCGADMRGENDE